MAVLQTYWFNNRDIKFLVRRDYIKSAYSQKKNFLEVKVIPSAIKVKESACRKFENLTKEQIEYYGLKFKIPLKSYSKKRRIKEAERFISSRLEKILNRFIQDGLIEFK